MTPERIAALREMAPTSDPAYASAAAKWNEMLDEIERLRSERSRDKGLDRILIWFAGDYLDDAVVAELGRDMTEDEYERFDAGQSALRSAVCSIVGHLVENDHCGRPDHRYCLICSVGTPNEPLGRHAPSTEEST